MADVTERGQIILVTGLALAVTLVAIVLVLNTVIYTENLATRGTGVGEDDAVEFRRAVVDGVGGLVDRENAAGYESYDAVAAEVRSGTRLLGDLLGRNHVRSGAVAEVDADGATLWPGKLVRQADAERELTAADGSESWRLASDVEDVRAFALTVTADDLAGANATEGATVAVDGGAASWRAAVYADTGEVALAVRNGTEGDWSRDVCPDAMSGATATVDFTRGTVNGEPCAALAFGKGVDGPYDLRYEQGDRAAGAYEFTLNTTGSAELKSGNFNATGSSPYAVDAVYAARVPLYYERPRLTFADAVRIAPGEPR